MTQGYFDRFHRREVLRAAGMGGALAFSSSAHSASLAAAGAVPFERAHRWMQVAFTEDDPDQYDPQFWFDYFKAARVEGACLSAGGGTAFYPTKLPDHRRARDLGDRDMFGEMTAGCKKLGMAVVARIDPHYIGTEAAAAHPDWALCGPDGKPRRHPVAPDLMLACPNGPWVFDFLPKVIDEIARTYPVDGFFGNRWGGYSSACYCESCKTAFKQASGFAIPASVSGYEMPPAGHREEDAARAYLLWYQDVRFAQIKRWTQAAQAVRPDLFFVGGPLNGLELDPVRLAALSPIQFIDHQLRKDDAAPWDNGRFAKQARAAMGAKPVVGIFSISYRWKDAVQSDAEIATWVADGVAQGFRPWMTKFNADPVDKRWMKVVQDRYDWLAGKDAFLDGRTSMARVGIVFSPETVAFYGRSRWKATVDDHLSGWYQALVEARVPFEMVEARQLPSTDIGQFRVLILPNIACLSDVQCEQIKAFVGRGGRIIATHETSLYDAGGRKRSDFGLADLFGSSFAGRIDEREQNAYMSLRGPHPMLAGLDGAPRVMGPTKRIHVEKKGSSATPLTYVPRYPDQPIERVFATEKQSDIPMALCREMPGGGRVAYFPNDIDRTFWEYLAVDHLALLRNTVAWAMDSAQPLVVRGAGMIDTSVWRQRNAVSIHLVNLTNPMTMRGPMREILPTGPFELDLQVPAGATVRSVRLLDAAKTIPFRRKGDRISFTVPRVDLHEIAVVGLG